MAKHRKSNKGIKKIKKHRQSKKSYRGGCDCNNNDPVMKGGYGPSNFSSLPSSNYYGLTNPTDLAFPQSSRIISGGKKNKKHRQTKKMNGGGNNFVEFTGNTSGAVMASNVYNGIPNPSNSITEGPLLNISSVYNA
jgi:hypothetical protein